jgi:hypothetical protein
MPSTAFAALAASGTPVVIPLAGMADWGLGHALDAEETVLMPVLEAACRQLPAGVRPLVLPPLRFLFGADPGCAFAVDQPAALSLITEVAASVGASGFSKVVLLNASPWNEEICAAAARDLRVSLCLHMFHVHLSALGLDFHPQRSQSRRRLQTLLTWLTGQAPEAAAGGAAPEAPWGAEPVGALPGPAADGAAAFAEGPPILAEAAGRLAAVLREVRARHRMTTKLTPP